jgi:hypothetical protein
MSDIGIVTNNKKVKMNYANYETSIIQQMGVHLVGWPKSVKFVNPLQISTVLEICTLHNNVKSGACHWVKLSRGQLDTHCADMEEQQEPGETVGRQRKKWSDAGTSRKCKQHLEDKENERLSKKRTGKKAMSTRQVKGCAVISDSSDSADDDDDDNDK